MSDQSIFTSFQVHMNPTNNGTNVAIPNFVPSAFTKYVSVVSASIPVTFYNCVGAFLLFEYRNQNSPSVVRNLKFIVPDGQYTIFELIAICRYTDTTTGISFFFEYDAGTGKVRAVMKDDPLLVSGLSLVPSSFASTLGFVGTTFTKSAYTYAGMAVTTNKRSDLQMSTATNVADMSGIRNVLIQTNYNIMSEASNKTLAKIPIDAPFGNIVQYKNPNGFRGKVFADDAITNIAVSIVDEKGALVNFNGVAWSVTLQFDFLKPDPDMPVFDAPDPELQPDSGSRPDLTLKDNVSQE
jgi:hypothetical protein